MAHHAVHRGTERRVGADAGVAVAAAALQAYRQVAGRHRLALHAVGVRQHALDQFDPARHRLGGAAGVLDAEGLQVGAFLQPLLGDQALDLVGLAAQADDEHGGEVGVARIAAQRAPQHAQFLARAVGGAAHAVRQRDHAVDVGEVGQGLGPDVAAEVVGDRARGGGRAVHAGQHADVVARGHAAVGAHDAVEGGGRGGVVGGQRAGARLMGPGEIAEGQVVHVHVLAGGDGLRGVADDLAVAPDRLARADRPRGDLVAWGHQAGDRHAFLGDHGAAEQLPACDDDVVGRVDADRGGGRCGHGGVGRSGKGFRRRCAPGPRRRRSAAVHRASRCPAA